MITTDPKFNSGGSSAPESSGAISGLRHFRLLMLSGGSLVGQNILSALAMRRDNCHLSVMSSKDDEPSIFDYDAVFLAPSLVEARNDFERRFEEVLSIVNPDLIIPCRDEDVAFVAGLAEKRPDLRGRLLCGSFNIAVSMLDKWLSWEFSNANDLPFAPCICADTDIDSIRAFMENHGLPLIAKPRTGFASRGVKLLFKESQLDEIVGRPDYILQKYLGDQGKFYGYIRRVEEEGMPLFHSFEDTKIAIQGCIGPGGKIGGVIVTYNVMRQGKSESVELCEDALTQQQGIQMIEKFVAAGWRGALNIQCQRDQDGNLCIYEYNGRFTGATAGRILLGFDEVGITLSLWLGNQFPQSGIRPGNKFVARTLVSKAVDLQKVNEVRQKGCWYKQSIMDVRKTCNDID
jgi:hypothetical protein